MACSTFVWPRSASPDACSLDQLRRRLRLQSAPVHGIDFIAIQTNESPFSGLQSDRIERFRGETQFIEFADGVGLNVDAQAEGLDVRDRFKNLAQGGDCVTLNAAYGSLLGQALAA